MSTAVQRRRGTTAQHAAFTGLLGEITVDTDKKVLVVHDALTAGGFPQAPASASTAAGTSNTPAGNISATNVQVAINELDSEKAPIANPTFTGKSTSEGSFGGGYAAQYTASVPGGTLGLRSGYSFKATFATGVDIIARRTADIRSGFTTGAWGSEYLAIGVGGATDIGAETAEVMRLNAAGNVCINGSPPAWAPQIRALNVMNAAMWTNGPTAAFGHNLLYGAGYAVTYAAAGFGGQVVFNRGGVGGISFELAGIGAAGAAVTPLSALNIDTAGNVLVTSPALLGYGPGAGGSVTQATSKSTAVTLNKPCGRITLSAEAMAAGAVIQFALNDSLITPNSVIALSMAESGPGLTSYKYWSMAAIGKAYICVQNIFAYTLSDALQINFTIIKGATA